MKLKLYYLHRQSISVPIFLSMYYYSNFKNLMKPYLWDLSLTPKSQLLYYVSLPLCSPVSWRMGLCPLTISSPGSPLKLLSCSAAMWKSVLRVCVCRAPLALQSTSPCTIFHTPQNNLKIKRRQAVRSQFSASSTLPADVSAEIPSPPPFISTTCHSLTALPHSPAAGTHHNNTLVLQLGFSHWMKTGMAARSREDRNTGFDASQTWEQHVSFSFAAPANSPGPGTMGRGLVVARAWESREQGVTVWWAPSVSSGRRKSSGDAWRWWLHNVNVVNVSELGI